MKNRFSFRHPESMLVAATLLAAVLGGAAGAMTVEEQGFEIAARSDRSDRGFGGSLVDMQMILRNAAGKEATRSLTLRTLEIPDESLGTRA